MGDRVDHRVDDLGVEHRAAGRHRPHGPGQLVALGDPVLQQVRVAGRPLLEQRDRVLGVVELRQHDHAGPGVTLADLVGGVDALALERGGHPDVGDHHLGRRLAGAGHELVVVRRRPDDAQVVLEREQGLDAGPNDQVVVGQKDGDGQVALAVVPSQASSSRRWPDAQLRECLAVDLVAGRHGQFARR